MKKRGKREIKRERERIGKIEEKGIKEKREE